MAERAIGDVPFWHTLLADACQKGHDPNGTAKQRSCRMLEHPWEGGHECSGGVCGAVGRTNGEIGPCAVYGHALLGELLDAVFGGEGTSLGRKFFERTVKHDNKAVLMKQRVVLLSRDDATATGDDKSGLSGNAAEHFGLAAAEGRLSLALDKFSTAHAELIGEGLVDVDVLALEQLCEMLAYACLAASRMPMREMFCSVAESRRVTSTILSMSMTSPV